MIGQLPAGQAPKVDPVEGGIGIWVVDDDDGPHGFLLSAMQATTVAVRLLRAVERQTAEIVPMLSVDAITFHVASAPEHDAAGLLTFTVDGTSLNVTLSEIQIAELAAGFTAAAKRIGQPSGSPRRDR